MGTSETVHPNDTLSDIGTSPVDLRDGTARTNAGLKEYYKKGYEPSCERSAEQNGILEFISYDRRKCLLEIGCGIGGLAKTMALLGHYVLAIDYVDHSQWKDISAICGERLIHRVTDYHDVVGRFDIVVMQGVLEHMDDPFETLKYIDENFKPQQIVTSSPNFLNPRGYIWMTFQYLLKTEMSLADIHFILPSEMEEWAEQLGYRCSFKSVDQDWGHGEKLIADYRKRLPKIADLLDVEADVPKFIGWLEKTLRYQNHTETSGATMIYNLEK